jgi:hypothetical protein
MKREAKESLAVVLVLGAAWFAAWWAGVGQKAGHQHDHGVGCVHTGSRS